MKKVYYINHFGDGNSNRINSLPGDAKMDYIMSTLDKNNFDLRVVSFCNVNEKRGIIKRYKCYDLKRNDICIHYLTSFSSKNIILRKIGHLITLMEGIKYLLKYCNEEDTEIIFYHSLSFLFLYNLLYKKRIKFTVEVEELYSDVMNNAFLKKIEIKALQKASKYIFITEILNKEINKYNKPYIISHGNYEVKPIIKCNFTFDKRKIHCVYAGTFNPKKGGAYIAIQSTKYLPSNYHVHILGYTSTELVNKIKNMIKVIDKESAATVSYDGVLSGNNYISFLQNCDIGLSTQNPTELFNTTSFPSKILSYLSNGLKVISARIPAIETSKVNNYIYYYDKQDPKVVAQTIMSVNLKENIDSRELIKKLDIEFKKDIKYLIGEVK